MLERVLRVLAKELQARGWLDLDEAYVDAAFAAAKKGAWVSGLPSAVRAPKIVAIADGRSLPLAVSVQSASPHESRLVEEVLAQSFSMSCRRG